jgi:hypothetical protein
MVAINIKIGKNNPKYSGWEHSLVEDYWTIMCKTLGLIPSTKNPKKDPKC